jgi:hypothetical protein
MKKGRIALCGVLVSTAAYAQPAPPAGEQPAAPPADPVETPPAPPAPPPPPAVVVVQEPAKTEVVVQPQVQADVDTEYRNAGLLFNLNNIFTQPGVLGGWQGFGLGVQKVMGNGKTMRVGIELARQTDPVNIVKTTRTNGMDEVVSFDLQLPGSGFSSQHAVAAVVDMIKPLTERTIAPYVGAGVFAGFSTSRLDYTDDLTITDQVTEVANSSTTFAVGIRGILGVAWKIGERFSLFAEYQLDVDAIEWQSDHTQTTTNNTVSGTPASNRVETEFKETRYFNLDLGLAQGGALGLVAHF